MGVPSASGELRGGDDDGVDGRDDVGVKYDAKARAGKSSVEMLSRGDGSAPDGQSNVVREECVAQYTCPQRLRTNESILSTDSFTLRSEGTTHRQ